MPVASELTIEKSGKDRWTLTLHVEILEGWHTYDESPGDSPYPPMKLALKLPEGMKRVGDWKKPAARPDAKNAKLLLFEGKLKFRCELQAAKVVEGATVACVLDYQVCNDEMCLEPSTDTLEIEVPR